jgi:carboxylesterase
VYTPSPFLLSLPVFSEPEHQPFLWEGERPGAVLLVHGFPGTPADLRPLGEALAAQGWTVSAPLLPGFGPGIVTLPGRRFSEWVDAVREELAALRAGHGRVVVVGHSLGGAVTLLATSQERTQGQALLSPYWRFGPPWVHFSWPLLRLLAGRWRPLKRADFADPKVRASIEKVVTGLDLDDAAVQAELRAFMVPTGLLDELRRLGIAAHRVAASARTPALLVQGAADTLVRPADTHRLARRMPAASRVEVVPGSHNIHRPGDAGWEGALAALAAFLEERLAA